MPPPENRPQRRRVHLAVAALSLLSVGLTGYLLLTGDGRAVAPAAEKAIPSVRVAQSARETLPLRLALRGELDADVAELSARSTGYLRKLSVDIGDAVEEGQVLGVIEADEVERQIAEARASMLGAEASVRRAKARVASAEVELERGRRLAEQSLISDKDAAALETQVDVERSDLEAAEARLTETNARVATLSETLRDAKLTAPFAGAVAERYVDPGSMVRPGTVIVRLVRNGNLRVRFRVPERDLSHIQPGLQLVVTTQSTGDRRFTGAVTRIAAEISRLDRSVAVAGVLDEASELLKPGMYANVELSLGSLDEAVVVPSAAVLERAQLDGTNQHGVFVVVGDKARWTPVSVRGTSGERTAVEPLDAGATVVTLGHDQLRDGAAVRVTEEPSP